MTAPPRRLSSLALVMIAALLVLPACGTERTAARHRRPPSRPSRWTRCPRTARLGRTHRWQRPPGCASPRSRWTPSCSFSTGHRTRRSRFCRSGRRRAVGRRSAAGGRPAVLVGHVDSRTGPAVFYRLRELAPGDEVLVDRADGTTARFIATSLDSYEKALFPSDLIYYPTLEPQLRLVTCGGPFDLYRALPRQRRGLCRCSGVGHVWPGSSRQHHGSLPRGAEPPRRRPARGVRAIRRGLLAHARWCWPSTPDPT